MTHARVLVVEDDAIVADYLDRTLRDIGYEVAAVVATGRDALECALRQRPDVVLMDIRLRGGMDGVQAAEAIRARSDLPVIFLSAYDEDDLVQHAKLLEPYGYLAKPVRGRELKATVEVALYRARTDRKLKHLNQLLRAAVGVSQVLTRETDLQRVLDRSCEILQQSCGYRRVWIERPAIWDARKGQAQAADGGGASLALPMRHKEQVLGALHVHAEEEDAFDEQEVGLLGGVADDLALAVAHLEAERRRQRTEEALRESENRFRTLSMMAPVGIVLADQRGDCLFVNEAWSAMTGRMEHEGLGTGWMDALHPQDRALVADSWYRFAREGGRWLRDFRFQRRDGSVVWVQSVAVALRDSGGRLTGYLAALVDITERRASEEEIRALNQRLKRQVRETTAELKRVRLGSDPRDGE
jgi:PAS domain S-box-containing protein